MTLFRKVLQPLMDDSSSRILTNFHIVSSTLKHRPHYLFTIMLCVSWLFCLTFMLLIANVQRRHWPHLKLRVNHKNNNPINSFVTSNTILLF